MTQSATTERVGSPGVAWAALVLGIIAVGTLALPPLPAIAGALGLAAALRARTTLRRNTTESGTAPSLLGAVLSVVGLLTATPWLFALVLTSLA
jgi:hypothetical protein